MHQLVISGGEHPKSCGGAICFDGTVLEAFGFGFTDSRRAWIGEVEKIELLSSRLIGTRLEVSSRWGRNWTISLELDDAERGSLEELVSSIAQAAGGRST